MRIGVHLGDVTVEGEDLFGDGVDIAARLEQVCPPGGVLISASAHEQLTGKLDLPFADAGEQRLKNIARPSARSCWHLKVSRSGSRQNLS